MNELQIKDFEQMDITSWNFEQLKEELAKTLSIYETAVYTDETIKSAKADKATLAKAKKIVEDQRKAYKAKCLEPYEELEPKIKEVVSMIEERRMLIDEVVIEYNERQKKEKEAEVKKYYDKKAFVLGELAAPLYNKILDEKWLNVSTGKAKYEEELQIAVNRALSDINEIKAMNSPYVETLLEKYAETLSVEEVKIKREELEVAANKARVVQQVVVSELILQDKKPEIKADEKDGVNIKVYANSTQMRQICDFMTAIGVGYEM